MKAQLPVVVLVLLPCLVCLTLLSLITTSNLTNNGEKFYDFLANPKQEISGVNVRNWSIELGCALLAAFYFFDIYRWPKACSIFTFPLLFLAALLFAVGLLFQTPSEPIIPIVMWNLAKVALMRILHSTLFKGTSGVTFSNGICITFCTVAVLVAVGWSRWVYSKLERLTWRQDQVESTPFVLWCSPAIYCMIYLLIGLWGWIRARYYREVVKHHDEDHPHFVIIPEMNFAILLFVLTALGAWVAASIAVTSIALSKMILQLSVAAFVCLAIYIVDFIGLETIIDATKGSDAVNTAKWFLFSDWVKGAAMLLFWPILPVYFMVELVHQRCRRAVVMVGLRTSKAQGCHFFTKEARRIWAAVTSWELGGVLEKSIYVGLGIFVAQVGVSQGLVVFLAWLNEYLESWTLLGALNLLFWVEIALFLFPPVSGIPLYMVAGIVVIPKWSATLGHGFYASIAAATAFCFVLKMFAIALEQKAIGEPCSRSVAVKKYIGVQTPAMKALRCLLEQPGFGAGKVAVLVGGPDWPTSVITGILRLPLCSMLCGSIPVLILIFPCVLGSGFMLKAGEKPDEASQYTAMANVAISMSAVLQGSVTMLATYYLQGVMRDHQADMDAGDWMRDPQEAEILAAIEQDRIKAVEFSKRTCWAVQPFWVRATLLKGSFFTAATVTLMINPVLAPFTKFELTDSVEALPGGAVSLVQPAGWAMLLMAGFSLICLLIFQVWCACRMSSREEDPGKQDLGEQLMAQAPN